LIVDFNQHCADGNDGARLDGNGDNPSGYGRGNLDQDFVGLDLGYWLIEFHDGAGLNQPSDQLGLRGPLTQIG
jgi:hypothetical protein